MKWIKEKQHKKRQDKEIDNIVHLVWATFLGQLPSEWPLCYDAKKLLHAPRFQPAYKFVYQSLTEVVVSSKPLSIFKIA